MKNTRAIKLTEKPLPVIGLERDSTPDEAITVTTYDDHIHINPYCGHADNNKVVIITSDGKRWAYHIEGLKRQWGFINDYTSRATKEQPYVNPDDVFTSASDQQQS